MADPITIALAAGGAYYGAKAIEKKSLTPWEKDKGIGLPAPTNVSPTQLQARVTQAETQRTLKSKQRRSLATQTPLSDAMLENQKLGV